MIFSTKSLLRALVILLAISTINVNSCGGGPKKPAPKPASGHHGHKPGQDTGHKLSHDPHHKPGHGSGHSSHTNLAHGPGHTGHTLGHGSGHRLNHDPKSTSVHTPSGAAEGKQYCDRCKKEIKVASKKVLCQECKKEVKVPCSYKKKTAHITHGNCPLCNRRPARLFRSKPVPTTTRSCRNCARFNIPCYQAHGRVQCLNTAFPVRGSTATSSTDHQHEKKLCERCEKEIKEEKKEASDTKTDTNPDETKKESKKRSGKLPLCAMCNRWVSRSCLQRRPSCCRVQPVTCSRYPSCQSRVSICPGYSANYYVSIPMSRNCSISS